MAVFKRMLANKHSSSKGSEIYNGAFWKHKWQFSKECLLKTQMAFFKRMLANKHNSSKGREMYNGAF